jgi:hypothetical protein
MEFGARFRSVTVVIWDFLFQTSMACVGEREGEEGNEKDVK